MQGEEVRQRLLDDITHDDDGLPTASYPPRKHGSHRFSRAIKTLDPVVSFWRVYSTRSCGRRLAIPFVIFILFIGVAYFKLYPGKEFPIKELPGKELFSPPEYHSMFKDVIEFESSHPQHTLDIASPEGRDGRYIRVTAQAWGSGYNNVLQEQLVNTHLAYLSRRAFVFPPQIARDHRPFPDLENLRIPSSAFSYSPTSGAPFPGSRNPENMEQPPDESVIPRSVSEEHWYKACPIWKRTKVRVNEESPKLGLDMEHDDMLKIMTVWGKKLLEMQEPCVEIVDTSIFSWMLFAGPRTLPVWSIFGNSAALTHWDWSPLIHSELERNGFQVPFDTPSARVRRNLPASHPWATNKTRTSAPVSDRWFKGVGAGYQIPKLVAIHLRRGDYENHCVFLSWVPADFNSWNQFALYSTSSIDPPFGLDRKTHPIQKCYIDPSYPALPDSPYGKPYSRAFPHDEHGRVNPKELTREQLVVAHCWPDIDAIRDKLRDLREEHPGLEDVYLMTNGKTDFIENVSQVLLSDGWKSVRSSLELHLSDPAIAVSQAVDMALGSWAEVFVGIGFSSMTSNTVGFRLAQGHDPSTTRFF